MHGSGWKVFFKDRMSPSVQFLIRYAFALEDVW